MNVGWLHSSPADHTHPAIYQEPIGGAYPRALLVENQICLGDMLVQKKDAYFLRSSIFIDLHQLFLVNLFRLFSFFPVLYRRMSNWLLLCLPFGFSVFYSSVPFQSFLSSLFSIFYKRLKGWFLLCLSLCCFSLLFFSPFFTLFSIFF